MKKLLFAFMATALFACSGDDSTPVDTNNENPENPDPVACTNVYNGSVDLSTQEEVNAFAASGYCKIKGHLYIGPRFEGDFETGSWIDSDITSLASLSSLQEITGGMTISTNNYLNSLNGLNNLKKVIGGVSIDNNSLITDLSALSNLSHIGNTVNGVDYYANLNIANNNALVSLMGLEHIVAVSDLVIENNPSLQNFTGLDNLEKVESILTISGNNAITSFQGLGALKEVGVMFSVSYNNALLSFHGLENLETATLLSVGYNSSLASFQGVNQLKYAEVLSFYNLPSLVSIEALSNVEEVASLEITTCIALTSLNGLQNVKKVGNLVVSGNSSLTSISHLSGLTVVAPSPAYAENNFGIGNNDALQSLEGLQNITEFEGKLYVSSNDQLTNFCALSTILATGTFTEPIYIGNNSYNPTALDITSGNCSE